MNKWLNEKLIYLGIIVFCSLAYIMMFFLGETRTERIFKRWGERLFHEFNEQEKEDISGWADVINERRRDVGMEEKRDGGVDGV